MLPGLQGNAHDQFVPSSQPRGGFSFDNNQKHNIMKKDFIVSLDDLDILQDKLWEFCNEHDYYMRTYPSSKTIEVWSRKEMIANIRIVALDEPHIVIDNLSM